MTEDQITAERRALYAQGGLSLRDVLVGEGARMRRVGRMYPLDETDEDAWRRAARYNWLAAIHRDAPARA